MYYEDGCEVPEREVRRVLKQDFKRRIVKPKI